MPADDLWAAMSKNWSLADSLLKFAYAFLIQVTHSALANGRFTIEQRLARWLLMAQDRLDGADVALTHEFLAMMLGVRRSGVTLALQELEGRHAIRSLRGHVVVRDRAARAHRRRLLRASEVRTGASGAGSQALPAGAQQTVI